jgi:CRP-like cAMP-binding protein
LRAPNGILNEVLRSLTLNQLDRLDPVPTTLAEGAVVYQQGEPITHLTFTDTGLFSTLRLVTNEHDRRVEIFCYGGRRLVLGAHTLLQQPESLFEYRVRLEGRGWLVRREALHDLMAADTGFSERMQAMNRAVVAGIAQAAACRAVHNHEQRLCRQLLMIRAALETDRIPLEVQLLAEMIPMNRQHLYKVARGLRDVFRFEVPGIEIIDPVALERRACTCFRQTEFARAQIVGDDFPTY